MYNKFTRVKIIVLIFIIIALTGVLIRGILYGNKFNLFSNRDNPSWAYKNKITREENLNGINKINFNTDVGEVILKTTDDSKIKVIERSNKKIKKDSMLSISKKGSSLNFTDQQRFLKFNFFGFNNKRSVEIYLPKNYKEELNLQTDVGDLDIINDLELNEIQLVSNVGDITSDRKIKAKSLDVINGTGDIDLNIVETNEYKLESDVGEIDIERLIGSGSVNSDVGDINCNIEKIDGHMEFSTDVGDLNLNIDKSQKFMLDADAGTGKVSNNVSRNIDGDSKNSIEARTDVGEIKLKYLD